MRPGHTTAFAFSWTGGGAACAGGAGLLSFGLSAVHTAAECSDDGFAQSDCLWSAGQTGLSGVTGHLWRYPRSDAGPGPVTRVAEGYFSRVIDFQSHLINLGISLERTGWYDDREP